MNRRQKLSVVAVVLVLVASSVGYYAIYSEANPHASSVRTGPIVKIDSISVSETSSVFVNLLLQTNPSGLQTMAGQPFSFNLTVGFFRTLDEGVIYTNATAIKGTLKPVTPGFVLDHVYVVGTTLESSQIIVQGDTTQTVTVRVTAPDYAYEGPLKFVLQVTPYTA